MSSYINLTKNNYSCLLVLFSLAILLTLTNFFAGQKLILKVVDISWPNCQRLANIELFSTVIVGVNGGLDFRLNPCLGNEIGLGINRIVYLNSGDPGFPRIKKLGTGPLNCQSNKQLICYSFNYGYMAAIYSIKQADLANAHSAFWWIDVEAVNSWTNSIYANRADIMGMIYALKNVRILKPKIGVYTTYHQWHALMGNWHLNLPLWLGTGLTSSSQAAKKCSLPSVLGSKIIFSQYTIANLDYDYVCH